LAKKVNPVAKAPDAVLILVPNVWVAGTKYLQHDVIKIDASDAELLIGNKQAKATRDDVTHAADNDSNRVEV
jgi:hypothetical protein